MRVALLTSGRFTLVDLARELTALGHEARVYSLVPPAHTRRLGLPQECNRWLGPYVAPQYVATQLAARTRAGSLAEHTLAASLDHMAARRMEPCDVVVAMSGLYVRSLDVARRRFGAKVFLERSSRHILSQREILEKIPSVREPVAGWAVDRELAGYELADVVSVPSMQVAESFLERGFPASKLFRNPFGVALDSFQPTPAPAGPPTILVTGGWSLRKGCDVLVAAWRRLPGTQLLHVGPVLDAPLPTDAGFTHVEPVPQSELPRFYARGDVFALASREEGLAVVQVQALACGLPIVCTSRTGGADLAEWATDPGAIRVVPPDDPSSFAAALADALRTRVAPGHARDLLGSHRPLISWRAYAQRYAQRMSEALAQ